MSDDIQSQRQKVYAEHWDELIHLVRAWRPDIADQLTALAPLRFGSSLKPSAWEDGPDYEVPVTSNLFSDEIYKTPKSVVRAVLKHLGGRATAQEIVDAAKAGNWRTSGKSPYYDIHGAIEYQLSPRERKRGSPILRKLPDGSIELIEGKEEAE